MGFSLLFRCNVFLVVFVVQYKLAQENANNDIAFAGFKAKENVIPADKKPSWTKKSANTETDVGNNL